MSEISQRGYDAEILALDILEKNGYEIIYAPEKEKREKNSSRFTKKNQETFSLLKKKVGQSIMPEINKNDWIKHFEDKRDSEDPSTIYYIEGYYQRNIDFLKNGKSLFELSYVDIFCKKGNDYYIFDIKHKTFKENKNLNSFDVTNYEVLNYNRIFKENKVKLKIMIILGKSGISYYRIFDWDEFTVPTKFDPNTKHRTKIKLKEGFDISKLKAV